MSLESLGLLVLLFMFLLMALRVPVSIALIVPGIIGAYLIRGWTPLLTSLETIIWSHSFNYMFSTIPMFVLMGEFLFISGISTELFDTMKKWFGRLKGGLATSTIGASAMFAAASGSSIASTGTMGVMAHGEMKKAGYSDSFSSGTIVAGGTLGILIPPSTAFIIYGVLTETSIGKLLIAGILPGILLTILFILTIMLSIRIRPELAPDGNAQYSWKEKFRALKSTIWIIVLFAVVIGGMYIGWFTPTEAAGVGAISAFLLAVLKRKISMTKFIHALDNTIKTTGFLFAIILGAFVLNYVLSLTGLPEQIATYFTYLQLPAWIIMMLIMIMYIILGAIMDSLAMIVITLPIIIPIVQAMGFDLVWFGVWIVVLIELGLLSPPIGLNVYVLKGAVPQLRLEEIFKGAFLFMVAIIFLLVLLYIFPEIALWLPGMM